MASINQLSNVALAIVGFVVTVIIGYLILGMLNNSMTSLNLDNTTMGAVNTGFSQGFSMLGNVLSFGGIIVIVTLAAFILGIIYLFRQQ